MDVRCERCGTEYDFDDALVSERGTTVKCTNCGHQFKVFPRRASGVGPERWIVRTATGGVISFTSLRELQKGIAAGRVGPADQLSRGGQPPRPLSSIAELEPFFQTAAPHAGVGGKTLVGVAPPLPDGSPSQPDEPAKSDLPPVTPGGRKRGVTVPRFSTIESVDAPPVSDFPTERRPEAPKSPPAPEPAVRNAAPVDEPRMPNEVAEAPTTRAAPGADGRVRVGTLGQLRADTDAAPADTVRGAARSPLDATQRSITGLEGMGGTIRMPSPVAPEPGPNAAPPAVEQQRGVEAEPRTESEALATTPDTATARSREPEPAKEAMPDHSGVMASNESTARQVPEVEPLEPAPTDAVEAVAARTEPQIQAEAERYFTPPPRELSFSGSLSDPDPRYVPRASPGGPRGRWIVGVIMLGALALLAGTVGLSFIQRYVQPSSPQSAPVDPRVAQFVADGRRRVDEGDLDGAAEELSKASVLAEREPTVLLARAELELVRADRLWLQLRLLDPTAEERGSALHEQLAVKVKRAREAVDAAVAVAGDEVGAARVRVDVLRLAGKLKEARQQVAPLGEDSTQPANAYVLAALDLAEAPPAIVSAIERLRNAVPAEGRVGRARAALIYALALNGELDAARSELSGLAGANEAHPLLPDLRAFVRRVGEEGDGTVLDADALAALLASDATARPPREEGAQDDFRARLAQANSASRNGHLEMARRLYQSVLNEQPGNTEAMAGLAEVARQRNDPGAAAMYDKVLEKNPSYLPALVARADQKWDAGDRSGAITLYRRVLAQAGPASSYGKRAQARIAEGGGGSDPKPAPEATPPAPEPGPKPTPAPTPAEPPPEQPHIDTTDLPGFQ